MGKFTNRQVFPARTSGPVFESSGFLLPFRPLCGMTSGGRPDVYLTHPQPIPLSQSPLGSALHPIAADPKNSPMDALLPYAFARRHLILQDRDEDGVLLWHAEKTAGLALLNAQIHVAGKRMRTKCHPGKIRQTG